MTFSERMCMALESYERASYKIEGMYSLTSFIGMESSFGEKLRNGWDFIVEKFRQLGAWIVRIIRHIGEAIGNFFKMFKKSPNKVKAKRGLKDKIKNMLGRLQHALEMTDNVDIDADITDAGEGTFDRKTEEMADALEKAAEELKKVEEMEAELEKETQEASDDDEEIDISDIKKESDELGRKVKKRCSDMQDAQEQCTKKAEEAQRRSDAEPSPQDTAKQRRFTKLGAIISRVVGFLGRIPGKIVGFFRRLFKTNGKVEEYTGPSPI